MTDEQWLHRAVELATANVADGGGPFGAIVVREGTVLATGVNRVTRDVDPSAHAEVTAIRAACREAGEFALTGAVLYASCEPCPMCLATCQWARLDRVVFAADRDDAAKAGFDDRAFHDLFGTAPGVTATWPTPVTELRLDGCTSPFQAWLANDSRTDY